MSSTRVKKLMNAVKLYKRKVGREITSTKSFHKDIVQCSVFKINNHIVDISMNSVRLDG